MGATIVVRSKLGFCNIDPVICGRDHDGTCFASISKSKQHCQVGVRSFFALGLLITISNELGDDLPSIGIIGYAQTTIQFIALVLLFRPASRRWFSKENLPS